LAAIVRTQADHDPRPAFAHWAFFPFRLSRPVLAVPAVTPARCLAISLYGAHASGTDLDHNERAMLVRIAHDDAAMYAELEGKELRQKVVSLEHEFRAVERRLAQA
jgi:hypothetical protein